MTNVVEKLSANQVESLLKKLPFETSNLPQGMRARIKHQGTTISVYQSNKVMLQGKNATTLANQLLPTKAVSTVSSTQTKNVSSTIHFDDYNCIGSDEAGSGDYFGPLTVCAAYVSRQNIKLLKTLGVDDSKKLNDNKIVALAEQIISFLPHSLLVLDNVNYNNKQREGWSQVKMKAVLHNEAIKNVTQRIDQGDLNYIVIDQFAQPSVYKKYALTDIPYPQLTHFETKGESKSLAIAAASIISRYAFIKHMDQLSQASHFTLPKGASNKTDLIAAQMITKYDLNYLDRISKKHFANRQKAINLAKARTRPYN
ncbi:ribonuclease HIII [Staphylococcus sp. SQ8-PEA]|uniref:Ribonuclease HIII n=1 Tax=Staphylococcus marylandisciuri TaxID=2981529 RepID=A0ABT2QNZ8_9STAP|nr:ribonuclease HIII [Staphylococcus marylandisciuri]MCU5745699.1 ribonuclease HIII [Staphylococcus marylandisciuri]